MTTIVVTATKAPLVPGAPATGIVGTTATVVDNSGASLPVVTLSGIESPPWSATMTGAAGANEATVTFQDVDINGVAVGSPITVTETGSGGVVGNLPTTSGGTITVS